MNVSTGSVAASTGGGEGGIRTHGRLAPTAVFKTAALNHSATSPAEFCLSRVGTGRARRALNQAGGIGFRRPRLGRHEEYVLSAFGRWIFAGVAAASLAASSEQAPAQYAQTYGQPSYVSAPSNTWDSYKVRLAALARERGVREATISGQRPGTGDKPTRDRPRTQ